MSTSSIPFVKGIEAHFDSQMDVNDLFGIHSLVRTTGPLQHPPMRQRIDSSHMVVRTLVQHAVIFREA